MINNTQIIRDISLLYELSLSVGKSLDLEENCKQFLDVLMARKELSFVSVWIYDRELHKTSDNSLVRVYAAPLFKSKEKLIQDDHYIIQRLKEESFFSLDSSDSDFKNVIQESNIEQGKFIIYGLSDIGYLKLHIIKEDAFERLEQVQLVNVIDRFNLSLKAAISYLKFKNETQERSKAQTALIEAQEKYRYVVESLSEGIILTDIEGRITNVNEQMAKLTGYTKNELHGQTGYKLLIAQSEEEKVKTGMERSINGFQVELELEHIRKNGERWLGHIKASPFRNANGEIIGTIGAVVDITEKKHAQQKLKESEHKLRQIIDTSLDAVITIDRKGMITEWSQQASAIFGYRRDEVIGELMSNIIIPEKYKTAHNNGMEHYNKTGHGPVLNKRIEITAVDKNGREFPIELSITPIEVDGRHSFSGFIRDITDRKKAENDLIKAKQDAEQARLAEQQFLANMSHEIRTPMNAVIGMTHLMYETKPTDAQKEYLDALRFSADSLMGIINNILDISKIEAGELEFEQRAFDLKELLINLQQTFQFKVKEKPVSVIVDIDSDLHNLVIGDSVRLNQVLTNLLGNASKFTQRGTIGVRAKLVKKESDIFWIEFDVHDTGIGIDKKNVNSIFENFKQADTSITRRYGGTGLGLAIVKQIVELQNGKIDVKSVASKGSNFIITLPFKDAGVKVAEKVVKDEPDQNVDDLLRKTKILVVEDNPMNQKLIKKIFDLWECPLDIANHGLEALEILEKKTYDIILMDIHMPELDGCETTFRIRHNKENPNTNIPIIALTAAALLEEKNRAFKFGMNDFLTKPFSPALLKKTLLKWLDFDYQNGNMKKEEEKGSIEEARTVTMDMAYLSELGMNDTTFVIEMIEIFLREIPIAIDNLKGAYAKENWSAVCDTAHRVKSNFMMMGMSEQQQAASSIETMIKKDEIDKEKIQTLISELDEDSSLAYPLLRSKLSEMKVES